MIRALLLDIEGTTSSLEFVEQVLFPYARQHLGRFIEEQRGVPEVEAELAEVERLARLERGVAEPVQATLLRWMAEDRKLTPLKALQGLLWEAAFARGAFVAPVYPDVPPLLAECRQRGVRLAVYSSGSVRAQRAFFRYSQAGDLSAAFDAWFDTAIGSKREASSYRAIAGALELEPSSIAFLSDSQAELDAARSAGLLTFGLVRGPLQLGPHPAASSFDALRPALELPAPGVATAPTPASKDTTRLASSSSNGGDEKATVVALARQAHARGWALATSGNFSVRAGADRMAITASGVDKGSLGAADVLWVGLDGVALEAGTPSAEAPLHAALYRRAASMGAVLHTHSIAGTLLSRRAAARGALLLSGYEMSKALAPVMGGAPPRLELPIFPNLQDTRELATLVGAHLARSPAPAYLIEGHGLTTWGPSAERARHHCEALEFLLACELEAGR